MPIAGRNSIIQSSPTRASVKTALCSALLGDGGGLSRSHGDLADRNRNASPGPFHDAAMKPVRPLGLLEADDDLVGSISVQRVLDRLHRVGVAEPAVRVQAVLA